MNNIQIIIASILGVVVLMLLIVKLKLHPFLSLLISSLIIGVGSGLDIMTLTTSIEEGAGKTLKGIVLLIGIGSLLGGILEASGGAKSLAQTLTKKFGEKKATIALGVTSLLVGTTIFFHTAIIILVPIAFSISKKTEKSTLYYVMPITVGLIAGASFIPPSTGTILVAGILGADLGLLILFGVITSIITIIFVGVFFSKYIANKIYVKTPELEENEETNLPDFKIVLFVLLIPLILILTNTIINYLNLPIFLTNLFSFLGTPFIALLIATLTAMGLLGYKQGYSQSQLKTIFENSLKPTASILLVIAGGGILSSILQIIGVADLIAITMQNSGFPFIVIAFLMALVIRFSVGSSIVAMTMTASILIGITGVSELHPLYLVAMVLAINSGATALSHFNDSGFWLFSSLLNISEKDTLRGSVK